MVRITFEMPNEILDVLTVPSGDHVPPDVPQLARAMTPMGSLWI